MAPPAQPNFALKSILEKDKLNGTNFTTWYRNLRIVLKHDKKEHVLEDPLLGNVVISKNFLRTRKIMVMA